MDWTIRVRFGLGSGGYSFVMSIDKRDSITEEVKKGVLDARDSAGEAMHHSAAEAERTRREVAGDTMTPGDKVASTLDEAKERIKEGSDHAKRNIRDST
ncbi:MAG: hypothetical protein JOZ01_06320 [Candidatus Eremiobacteraeota bacterium]|nr:hypothetical protein [Candidatus Eremiobacteraeota bacterium]